MIESVSLCMVTYNEAHRIYDTLNKAAAFVDEIIIVDQGSTDGTVNQVARFQSDLDEPLRVEFILDKHYGYCEPSRGKAHEASTGDWVLVLDADERISDEFAIEYRHLDERGFYGARLKRSLYLGGLHHFTGDYQYRYFRRDCVKYLDEMHTEPQPTVSTIYAPDYIGIYHEKSWSEQVRDEIAYESLIQDSDPRAEAKRALNVHLKILNDLGVTAEELDSMDIDERKKLLGL